MLGAAGGVTKAEAGAKSANLRRAIAPSCLGRKLLDAAPGASSAESCPTAGAHKAPVTPSQQRGGERGEAASPPTQARRTSDLDTSDCRSYRQLPSWTELVAAPVASRNVGAGASPGCAYLHQSQPLPVRRCGICRQPGLSPPRLFSCRARARVECISGFHVLP